MGSILRNNRRMFWEILNRIIGRKNRIIGTGLLSNLTEFRGVAEPTGPNEMQQHGG